MNPHTDHEPIGVPNPCDGKTRSQSSQPGMQFAGPTRQRRNKPKDVVVRVAVNNGHVQGIEALADDV